VKSRTSTGHVEHIRESMEAPCGGAVERKGKMTLDASSDSTSTKMTMRWIWI